MVSLKNDNLSKQILSLFYDKYQTKVEESGPDETIHPSDIKLSIRELNSELVSEKDDITPAKISYKFKKLNDPQYGYELIDKEYQNSEIEGRPDIRVGVFTEEALKEIRDRGLLSNMDESQSNSVENVEELTNEIESLSTDVEELEEKLDDIDKDDFGLNEQVLDDVRTLKHKVGSLEEDVSDIEDLIDNRIKMILKEVDKEIGYLFNQNNLDRDDVE